MDATINTSERISQTATTDSRFMETFVLVWLVTNLDKITSPTDNDIAQLRRVINSLRIFNDRDMCIDYITECRHERVFLIVTSLVGEHLVPLIDQIDEIDSIYVYSQNKAEHVLWAQLYRKVHGVFVDINSICVQLNEDTCQRSNNMISMSSIPSSFASNSSVKPDEVSFMYTQLIRDIFLVMEHPHHPLRDMISHFIGKYENNDHVIALLDELERDYFSQRVVINTVEQRKSIWWYSRCPFIFETLNNALRIQDIDLLYKMRFFITDLHKQLQQLYSAQSAASTMPMVVYRGQAMSNDEFQKHRLNIDGLLSMNNFLSTSTDRNVGEGFAFANTHRPGMEAVLFEIEMDPQVGERCPFATIEHLSYFRTECEVLISMGSVFRIRSVERDSNGIWNIRLKFTGEEDEQLKTLADVMWEKIRSEDGLLRLAKLMRLMGNFKKGKMFLYLLMNETIFCDDPQNLAQVINEIGRIYEEKGDSTTATLFYHKFIEIKQKRRLLSSNDTYFLRSRVTRQFIREYVENKQSDSNQKLSQLNESFQNEQRKSEPNQQRLSSYCAQQGEIYEKQENNTEALRMYEESLKLFSSINHLSTIKTFSILALLNATQGNWDKAKNYVEKTLIALPHFRLNDLVVDVCYERIGLIYEIQERYVDAIAIYQTILTCFSDNNPDFDIVLANIGHAYEKQGNYSASLEAYERLLSIQLDTLYRDHPLLADTYTSIARLLQSQNKYKEAHTNLAEAIRIDLIAMTSNHPWIKKRQAEIDTVQQKMIAES